MKTINLGDEVKHRITGFKGIVVAETSYLSGCKRLTIQPQVKKDGTLPEACSFDEPEIDLVKSKKEITKKETGGWKPTYKSYLR